MATLVSNGSRLFYALEGPEAAPAVVLVHGSWTDHRTWDLVAPRLARDFRVLRYDRRGHGASEPPTGEGTLAQDLEDLFNLTEALGLGPAHLVGNSFGAILSLRFAALHPERVLTLCVHEPPMVGALCGVESARPLLREVEQRFGAVIALLERGDAQAGAERFVETVALGPGNWQRLPPPVRESFVRNAFTWLDEMRDDDALAFHRDLLRSIRAPAVLTLGTTSPPMFRAIAGVLQDVIPGVALRTIEGAGHNPHATHPLDLEAVVREVVGRRQEEERRA